jgi:hypothetical protein
MRSDQELFDVMRRYGVPFCIIGGHAVNFHGYGRSTEDVDIVWIRSLESERALLNALTEMDARYIGDEIDPTTKIERTHPVTIDYIQTNHLMMLFTKHGFLDLFDFIPGLPESDVQQLLDTSAKVDGLPFASLQWLRKMKLASDRPKDQMDLENLPREG